MNPKDPLYESEALKALFVSDQEVAQRSAAYKREHPSQEPPTLGQLLKPYTDLRNLIGDMETRAAAISNSLPELATLVEDREAELLVARRVLADFTDFTKAVQKILRQLVIDIVKQGTMSRVKASQILGVHQSTVAQWVKDAERQQKP